MYHASIARNVQITLYAARKAFCTIIAAVGMSISLLGTLGCDIMKGGRGGAKLNVTITLFGPIIVWKRPLNIFMLRGIISVS